MYEQIFSVLAFRAEPITITISPKMLGSMLWANWLTTLCYLYIGGRTARVAHNYASGGIMQVKLTGAFIFACGVAHFFMPLMIIDRHFMMVAQLAIWAMAIISLVAAAQAWRTPMSELARRQLGIDAG